MEAPGKFRLGRLDHVHIRVPNREEAVEWYCSRLGFERVAEFEFWATGFEGGPQQISADGGNTTLAVFEASAGHPMIAQKTGIAFSVDAENFALFARRLPGEFLAPDGHQLHPADIVDLDLCWSIYFCDPWGNQLEINSYDYEEVRTDLILADGITPTRLWPTECYSEFRRAQEQ